MHGAVTKKYPSLAHYFRVTGVNQPLESAQAAAIVRLIYFWLAREVSTRMATTAPNFFFLEQLEKLRRKLLDLSTRNRLLSFKYPKRSASTLRFVDVDLHAAWAALTAEEGSQELFVECLPEQLSLSEPVPFQADSSDAQMGQSAEEDDTPALREGVVARQLGWGANHDLGDAIQRSVSTGQLALRVLLFPDRFGTVIRNIENKARAATEETGAVLLHLIFGFLEWYEQEKSEKEEPVKAHFAPLLAVPVLIRARENRERGSLERFVQKHDEGDLRVNPALKLRMWRDFEMILPPYDECSAEEYFRRVENVIARKPGWRVCRQITLGFLNFSKFGMYEDLDLGKHPELIEDPILRELVEGTPADQGCEVGAQPPAEEDERAAPMVTVLDADSSQLEVLGVVSSGRNLVVQGPPGTGKSQTIVNIIAVALKEGKSVLFMAAKKAALDVVYSRLSDAKLSEFCLAAHSDKASRREVVRQIRERMERRGQFPPPAELAAEQAREGQLRKQLLEYSREMHREIEGLKKSGFDAVWKREHLALKLSELIALVPENDLGGTTKPGAAEQWQYEVQAYAGCIQQILQNWGSVSGHPWSWVDRACPTEMLMDVQSGARLVRDEAKRVLAWLENWRSDAAPLAEALGMENSLSWVRRVASCGFAGLEVPRQPCAWLVALCDPLTRAQLTEFVRQVETTNAALSHLLEIAGIRFDQISVATAVEIRRAASAADAERLLPPTTQALRRYVLGLAERCRQLRTSRVSFSRVCDVFGEPADWLLPSVRETLSVARCLQSAPLQQMGFAGRNIETALGLNVLDEGERVCGQLLRQQEELASHLDLDRALVGATVDEMHHYARTIERAGWWQRILGAVFGGTYGAALREMRSLQRTPQRLSPDETAKFWRSLAAFKNHKREFELSDRLRDVLGQSFRGLQTDWSRLRELLDWQQSAEATAAQSKSSGRLIEAFRTSDAEGRLRRVREIEGCASQFADLDWLVGSLEELAEMAGRSELLGAYEPLAGLLNQMEERSTRVSTIDASLNQIVTTDVRLDELSALASSVDQVAGDLRAIDECPIAIQIFGGDFSGVNTDVGGLAKAIAFVDALAQSGLPDSAMRFLCAAETEDRLRQLRLLGAEAAEFSRAIDQACSNLARMTSGSGAPPVWWDDLRALSDQMTNACENALRLGEWVKYRQSRNVLADAEIVWLAEAAEQGRLPAEKIELLFAFYFWQSAVKEIVLRHPEWQDKSGLSMEQYRRKYAESDLRLIALHRQQVAAVVDQRRPEPGSKTGPKSAWSGGALLEHEANKQKKHLPLRRLMEQAGDALTTLMPCFMMGPISVAQHLPIGRVKFDLLVIDEASQMLPEDAIGAAARARQVVVIGDSKQLPPTDFFQRAGVDGDGGDGDGVAADAKSVLEAANNLYSSRMLRWHYRSRHHSLISFSNQAFYRGELIVLPSPLSRGEGGAKDVGVRYHWVGGVYGDSTNPEEARRVVESAVRLLRAHPGTELGLVAMNVKQEEQLELLWEHEVQLASRRGDPLPKLRFIKNLESVQGDECDVVFISTTYGADSKGNQYDRFGALTRELGWRRMNVLVTRARQRVEVFTSLHHEQINANSGESGVWALKRYLEYAKTGEIQNLPTHRNEPDNDFESAVGAMLRLWGYEVDYQVGVKGYAIDLGVRYPGVEARYLAGVECDGAAYHSSRSARDRDRIRQTHLENMGWSIVRVWSSDWFHQPKKAKDRLQRDLERIASQTPEVNVARAEKGRALQLQEGLEVLRRELAAQFPDVPSGEGLLSVANLERIRAGRPTTLDDLHKMVPKVERERLHSWYKSEFGRVCQRVTDLFDEGA